MLNTKNADRIALLATYLLANTSRHKGKSIKEITEDLPNISRSSITRIIATHPSFKQVNAITYPPKYWFDSAEATQTIDPRMTIDLFHRVEPDEQKHMFLVKLSNAIKEQDTLLSELRAVAKAYEVSINFQTGAEPLDMKSRDAADKALTSLMKFADSLHQRIYDIQSDPAWKTPEWWTIFRKVE